MVTVREKKYCSCVIKVSGNNNKNKNNDKNNDKNSDKNNSSNTNQSPYGLCTYSLYNKQGLKRDKVIQCDKIINFKKYNINELRGYAKMKKIKVTSNGKYKSKDELVKDLYKLSK